MDYTREQEQKMKGELVFMNIGAFPHGYKGIHFHIIRMGNGYSAEIRQPYYNHDFDPPRFAGSETYQATWDKGEVWKDEKSAEEWCKSVFNELSATDETLLRVVGNVIKVNRIKQY